MCSTAGLGAALDALAGDEVALLSDASLRGRLLDLLTATNRLQAELARTVGQFDTRGLSTDDGCRSAKTWLQAFARVAGVAAGRLVRRGRLMRRLPA